MLKVEFNTGPARDALTRARSALMDLAPLHQEVGNYVYDQTKMRLSASASIAGTAPDGTRWAPKAESTIAFYARHGYGGMAKTRTLYKAGFLSNSIVRYADRNGAVIGSSMAYAGVMQDGAARGAFGRDRRGNPIPWGTIPARRWLGLSIKDEAAIVAIAEEYVERAIQVP